MTANSRLEKLSNSDRPYLTDGGLETTLIFHEGIDLPEFAAFVELDTPEGRDRLTHYYNNYLEAAKESQTGFVLDTPTWRAGAAWGKVI